MIILAVVVAGCTPQQAPEAPAAPEPAQPSEPAATPAPAETAQPEAAPEGEADMMEETEAEPKRAPMTGEFIATKETGVVRGVGCDRESNTVLVELHNPTETDWTFYEKKVPTPPNQIKVILNGLTLLNMDCDADLLAAGETVKCSKTGSEAGDLVKFREPRGEFLDDVTTVATGGRDELKFRCTPRGDWTPEVEEDYSDRVE